MAQKVKLGSVVTVATAGTAVALDSSPIASSSIVVQSDPTNTGRMYVGDSTVDSTNGVVLEPGQTFEFEGDDRRGGGDEYRLDEIFVDAAVNGEKVRVLYSGRP